MKFFSGYKVFNDVETTGFSHQKNDVIVSSFIVTDEKLNELAEKTFYLRPLNPNSWTAGAEKIHKISLEQALAHADTAIDMLWFLNPFIVANKYAEFISHSANDFDYRCLEWLYRKQDLEFSFWKMFNKDHTSSTIKMAREKLQLPNNDLNTLCSHFNIPLNHHEAKSDTRGCFEVYKRLST